MRLPLYICGAVCSALLLTDAAVAQLVVVQIVDLTETAVSAEGGEATLYRVQNTNPAVCKIEAIHLGEAGKSIHVFDFGSKLLAAEVSEYSYKTPLNVDPKAKLILRKKVTLASPEGRQTLPAEFEKYKSLFDAGHLAKCQGS